MKNWGLATIMYEGDFSDKFPLFGENSQDYTKPFWFEYLATYVAKQAKAGNGQLEGDPFAPRRLGRLGGEVSQRSEGFEQAIEHNTVLQPWLCGGPLVDLDGKAIGINIARASRVSTYALPSRLVKQILDNLKTKAKSAPPAGKLDAQHRL